MLSVLNTLEVGTQSMVNARSMVIKGKGGERDECWERYVF